MGQDRYNGIDKKYQKYLKNNSLSTWIVLVALCIFFIGIPVFASVYPNIPSGIRSEVTQISFLFVAALLLLTIRIQRKANKFLPSIEDRIFYFVSTAISQLTLFASSGEELDKESALESLTKAASTIDLWTWGNLNFLRDGVGKAMSEFKTNFRGRLIPAIGRADKKNIQSFFMQLNGFVNAFGLNQLDQVKIEAWNRWLTIRNPVDSKEVFPYQKPRPSPFRRILSKRLHISVIVLVLLAPLAAGLLGVYVLQIPVEAAYQDAVIVFSGMIILLVYLFFGRQKSS